MAAKSRGLLLQDWLPRLAIDEPLATEPVANDGTQVRSAVPPPPADTSAPATVLVAGVEPFDPSLQRLAQAGHRMLSAADAQAAADLFQSQGADLVILHERLARGDGAALVQGLRALSPTLPIFLRGDTLSALQRGELVRTLALNASYAGTDDPQRVVELVDGALGLCRSLDRLRAEQEVRGLVLAKLCHDLRSPLYVIQGYTEMLRDEPDADERDELLARLAAATETALSLVYEYLADTRLDEPGATRVRRERLEVDELMMEMLCFAGDAIGDRPVSVQTSVPFIGASLYADGDKLREILRQLLLSAIHFTASGEIRLTVRSGAAATDFVVEDNGAGTPGQPLATRFAPLHRSGDETASRADPEVGLAIAERLSTVIGGSLTARESRRGGALLTLRVPAPLIAQGELRAPTLH